MEWPMSILTQVVIKEYQNLWRRIPISIFRLYVMLFFYLVLSVLTAFVLSKETQVVKVIAIYIISPVGLYFCFLFSKTDFAEIPDSLELCKFAKEKEFSESYLQDVYAESNSFNSKALAKLNFHIRKMMVILAAWIYLLSCIIIHNWKW